MIVPAWQSCQKFVVFQCNGNIILCLPRLSVEQLSRTNLDRRDYGWFCNSGLFRTFAIWCHTTLNHSFLLCILFELMDECKMWDCGMSSSRAGPCKGASLLSKTRIKSLSEIWLWSSHSFDAWAWHAASCTYAWAQIEYTVVVEYSTAHFWAFSCFDRPTEGAWRVGLLWVVWI